MVVWLTDVVALSFSTTGAIFVAKVVQLFGFIVGMKEKPFSGDSTFKNCKKKGTKWYQSVAADVWGVSWGLFQDLYNPLYFESS